MTKFKGVKVELTLLIECEKGKHNELELMIDEGVLNEEEYSLSILGITEYEDNVSAIYILMNTDGTYENNLPRLSRLHTKIDKLLKDTSIKYISLSLIPNNVKWDK